MLIRVKERGRDQPVSAAGIGDRQLNRCDIISAFRIVIPLGRDGKRKKSGKMDTTYSIIMVTEKGIFDLRCCRPNHNSWNFSAFSFLAPFQIPNS